MRLVFGYVCAGFFSVVLMECPEHRWHHFMGWVLDRVKKREEAELWSAHIHYSLFLVLDVMYPGLPSSCCCCGLGPGTISQNKPFLSQAAFSGYFITRTGQETETKQEDEGGEVINVLGVLLHTQEQPAHEAKLITQNITAIAQQTEGKKDSTCLI